MPSIHERHNGDGSTTYQVRWRVAGRQRSVVAPSMSNAKKIRALVVIHGDFPDQSQDGPTGDAPTFGEWTQHYLAHLTGVSDRTRDDYTRMLARHMAAFSDVPIPSVTRDVVRRWVLERNGEVSGKTLKNLHGLLHGVFAGAIEAGHLFENPARGVRLPRSDDHEQVEMAFLTPDEFWLIAEELTPHWQRVFVLLAATGLRVGELMALTVGDVDLEARQPVVRVTKALRYTRGQGFAVGPTKTRRSRRSVSLPPSVLDDVRAMMGTRPKSKPLVVQPNGRPMYPTNLYARIWRPAVERAQGKGLTKNPRIHDLRHTHVAWLIAENTPIAVIQARLGHEQITTTVDRYGHLLPDLHMEAAAATQRALER